MRWEAKRTKEFEEWWHTLTLPEHEGASADSDDPSLLRLRSTADGVLLIGGDKAGQTARFYRRMISKADKIYDGHLRRVMKGETTNESW